MAKNKNIYLLTSQDLRRIKKLARTLEMALAELIELKRITTLDDERRHYSPSESDLLEEQSFLEYQLEFFPRNSEF